MPNECKRKEKMRMFSSFARGASNYIRELAASIRVG